MSASVLVVEDEALVALDIEHSLRRRGYRVAGVAGSANEAIDLARQSPPDLVLMDVRLRGSMDGIEAAQVIRKERDVPVIFLTAFSDQNTLQRAKLAEPFAYLLKPFEEAVLATNIEMALHTFRTGESMARLTREAMTVSQICFDQLAEHAREHAIILLDAAGIIRSWNPGAEALYGWTAAEALGMHSTLLHPTGKTVLNEHLQTAARIGFFSAYDEQVRKSGSIFPAELTTVALSNSSGQCAGYLKLTREVMPGGKDN